MAEHRRSLALVLITLILVVIIDERAARKPHPSRDILRTPNKSWTEGRSNNRDLPPPSSSSSSSSTTRRQQPKFNKKTTSQKEKKPNIILILTDDQDIELGSMNNMPKTLQILRDGGVHFPNAYVTTPMCCPSRSSILTGMYVHNHNVFTNNDNCSSPYWQQNHESRSFATYLNDIGYRTGYFGKYLNEYNGTYIPRGWREWAGLIRNSRFYNYSINFNGIKVKHGDDYHKDYYSDLITNDSLSFFRHSKRFYSDKPVLLVISYPAPHGPEDAAPQYQKMFFNDSSHRTANWNSAPNPDKQWILRYTGKMEPIHIKFTDVLHTKRLQTLQSVDEALEKLYNELKLLGELDNTYIIYTSDHGYHLGQFGLVKGKAMPFEFDVKVPFFVRGPGVPKGISIPNIVLNLDLAPTILDLAGVEVPQHMDGKSIKKLLAEANEIASSSKRSNRRMSSEVRLRKPWRDTFLIESSGRRNGLERWSSWMNPTDRHETMTKDQRLNELCQTPEYQAPCQPGQKWECTHDGVRWRKHKCRLMNVNERRKTNCICPEDMAGFAGLDMAERNAQRAFIRDHVNKKDFKPRFINPRQKRSRELTTDSPLNQNQNYFKMQNNPQKNHTEFDLEGVYELYHILRAMDENDRLLLQQQQQQTLFKRRHLAQRFIKKREIVNEMSSNPRAISQRSLKKLPYLKSVDCHLNGSIVNCSEIVYQDANTWRESKVLVDVQIKELKEQLEELKGIRKHLKHKRPLDRSSKFLPTVPVFEEDGGDVEEEDEDEDDEGEVEGDSSESKSDEDKGDFGMNSSPCTCSVPFGNSRRRTHRDEIQEDRLRQKEERLRYKERKIKKKAKYVNTTCNAEKMNCFTHDNNHWKTPPLWTFGPFCFCQNANNNTYWCLRTLNETHNFLFCEFVTGFLSYYDMRTDPYQMKNIIHDIPIHILHQLHIQLMKLRECQGARQCTVQSRIQRKSSTGIDINTYDSDVAAAQISKHSSRHGSTGQHRWIQKRRRQG